MRGKPGRTAISGKTQEMRGVDLLESLAETRVSVLYLARRAQETKDAALANELTEKGQSLKIEIARIRRTRTVEWTKEASVLLKRSRRAQTELAELTANMEKSARKTKGVTRALTAVSNILALAKKVL